MPGFAAALRPQEGIHCNRDVKRVDKVITASDEIRDRGGASDEENRQARGCHCRTFKMVETPPSENRNPYEILQRTVSKKEKGSAKIRAPGIGVGGFPRYVVAP